MKTSRYANVKPCISAQRNAEMPLPPIFENVILFKAKAESTNL